MNWIEIFTAEEWNELKAVMGTITHTIPEAYMGKVWNWYQRIGKHNSAQPCSCQSSAKYWIEAVNVVRGYINSQPV